MRNLIRVGNNIDKLIAFNPGLDPNYRQSQRIFTPKPEVEVLDVVESFQKEGWEIDGARSGRDSMGKPYQTVIRMYKPDLDFGSSSNREGHATATLSTVYNKDNFETNTSLGALRLVCDNGLVTERKNRTGKIHHVEFSETKLNDVLKRLEEGWKEVKEDMDIFKFKMLTPEEQMAFAERAAKLRKDWLGKDFDYAQLIRANRSSDDSDSLWMTYNRIQENIIKVGAVKDSNNRNISIPLSAHDDLTINRELYKEMVRINGVIK